MIDIAPTLDMYARTDMAFARAYYHWFHLIQPAAAARDRMIGGSARTSTCTSQARRLGIGQTPPHIEPQALTEYERCFCRPEAIHSALRGLPGQCRHRPRSRPREPRAAGDRIACDTMVLWGARGVVQAFFRPRWPCGKRSAGPRFKALAMPAGHFIPEELPAETAAELHGFFGAA